MKGGEHMIGDNMLNYRAEHKLSVEDAAEKCGISAQTWRYVERGIQTPNRLTQRKIELFLKGVENETVNQSDQTV